MTYYFLFVAIVKVHLNEKDKGYIDSVEELYLFITFNFNLSAGDLALLIPLDDDIPNIFNKY